MIVIAMFSDHRLEDLGFIPSFLNDADPRPAKQQLDEAYQHGGGWRPMGSSSKLGNFTLDAAAELTYRDDDVSEHYEPIGAIRLRNETIYVYRHDFVCIRQKDGTFEVARMD